MSYQNKSPALVGNPGLRNETHRDYTAPAASCAKAAAVALYCYQILSLEHVAIPGRGVRWAMKNRPSKTDIRNALRDLSLLYKPPDKEKPAAGNDGPEGKTLRVSSPDSTLGEADRQREAETRAAYLRYCLANDPDSKRLYPYAAGLPPSCGKAAAIGLYTHQILPLHRVAAMFRCHPEWRAA